MAAKRTGITDKQLAVLYSLSYFSRINDVREIVLQVLASYLDEDLVKHVAEDVDIKNYIDIWILAIGLLPLTNISVYKKTEILEAVVMYFSVTRELDEEWVMEIVLDVQQDTRRPREIGFAAPWLIENIFDNVSDVFMEAELDSLVSTEFLMLPWKEISQAFSVSATL